MRKSRVAIAQELIAARDAALKREKQAAKVLDKAEKVNEKAVEAIRVAEEKVKASYIVLARTGMAHIPALKELRITIDKYNEWILEDPGFHQTVKEARKVGRDLRLMAVEDRLNWFATKEDADRNSLLAAMFLAKALDPDTYGEGKRYTSNEGKRVEVVIKDGRDDEQKAIPADFTVETVS